MLTKRLASTSKEKPYVVPAEVVNPDVGKHDLVPPPILSSSEYKVFGAGGGGGGAEVVAGGSLVVAGGGGGGGAVVETGGGIVVVDATTEQASPLRSCLLNFALLGLAQTAPWPLNTTWPPSGTRWYAMAMRRSFMFAATLPDWYN